MGDEQIRQQDRGAQNAIARAYGLPEPYRRIQVEEVKEPDEFEIIRLEEEQRISRAEKLVAELESMHLSDGKPLAHRIARAVAKFHGVSWSEMVSARRWKDVVIARHHAMWEVKDKTSLSLPAIGRVFGGKDHTTVLNAIRRHQARLDAGMFPAGSGR